MNLHNPNDPRILVFAYSNVGYECLKLLLSRQENVIGVVTHEDNPNEKCWFASVAKLAQQYKIPVYTPKNVNQPEHTAKILQLKPDLIFSFYYRNLINDDILQSARLGAFNMHGSLLPKYRGRAPINWVIINGETGTGATLHYMVRQADAGDIVDQQAVTITHTDTAKSLAEKVTQAATQVLARQLDAIKTGNAPRIPQDHSQASYFGKRTPEDGKIDWQQSASQIYNLIRALTHPYPGAFTELKGQRYCIWQARPHDDHEHKQTPGSVISTSPLLIATGKGALEILQMDIQ